MTAAVDTKSAQLKGPLTDDWWPLAACKDADPNLFVEIEDLRGPIRKLPDELLATAYRYCAGCPVRSPCTAEADKYKLGGLLGGVYRSLNIFRKGEKSYRRIDLLSPDYDFDTGIKVNKGGRPRKRPKDSTSETRTEHHDGRP